MRILEKDKEWTGPEVCAATVEIGTVIAGGITSMAVTKMIMAAPLGPVTKSIAVLFSMLAINLTAKQMAESAGDDIVKFFEKIREDGPYDSYADALKA